MTDPQQPAPTPPSPSASAHLESLLVAAANDPAAAPAFLDALLDATVLVPGTATDDGRANLANLLGQDGASVLPFYTSEDRLRETLTAVPTFERAFLGMPCRVFWDMTRGATLVLNPHSPYGKTFLPGEIGQLLDGAATLTPRVVTESTRILVGRPAHVPPGMLDALSDLFGRHPEVDEAVLGWKVTPEADGSAEGKPDASYYLVVVGDVGARDALNPELARALVTYSMSAPVDVQFVEARAGHALKDIPPFYRRKRGWFRR